MRILVFTSVLFCLFCSLVYGADLEYKPVDGHIKTRWADTVSPANVHREYPRPQMVRKDWLSLNGFWDYAIRPRPERLVTQFDGKILVPFAAESALSGVGKAVGEGNRIWYHRTFEVPKQWQRKQILLHFGAVDYKTVAYVNGKRVGIHLGGYDAFSFDITDALKKQGEQKLLVAVWDPSDGGTQPRGKQVKKPDGIWYTSVTGIWQSVWLEAVPKKYIKSIEIVPDIDNSQVKVTAKCLGAGEKFDVLIEVKEGEKKIAEVLGKPVQEIAISIKNPKLWSPDSPYLYDLKVILKNQGKVIDSIESYFGMRKISLGKDKDGFTRMMLNNKFVFEFGPLDQGWWPDGLYTAPSDEALKYDIEVTKKFGFNMARKHVKVEPDRWYYWCDKLGLLVWQDMPNGDEHIGAMYPDIKRSEKSAYQYEFELKRMINNLRNHPCIVVWVPFNEGWGQFDTARITKLVEDYDPTRLVNSVSGWADRGTGDVLDIHNYPGPAMPKTEEKRAIVLGEFGGLGLPVRGHTWQDEKNWGYRNYKDVAELTDSYRNLIEKLFPMVDSGLSAAVYTQTTDVEIEVNGLMTYDRAVIKMDMSEIARINKGYIRPLIKSEKLFIDSTVVEIVNLCQPGKIKYKLDGKDPSGKGAKVYKKPIKLEKSTIVTAKTYWPDKTQSGVSEKRFEKVKPEKAVDVTGLKQGIKFAYYEEVPSWDKLPEFTNLKPKVEGIAKKFDLNNVMRKEYYALKFEGYIEISAEGVYTFYTNSDDGSELYIGETKVVANDYLQAMTERSGQVALKKGLHAIGAEYYQAAGGAGFEVSYKGQGIEKQQIPSDVLFYKE